MNSATFLLFLPGLTVEDFGKESQGEMIIEYLQMRHKCVITVQDLAAADTRYHVLLSWVYCIFSANLSDHILSRNSVTTSCTILPCCAYAVHVYNAVYV